MERRQRATDTNLFQGAGPSAIALYSISSRLLALTPGSRVPGGFGHRPTPTEPGRRPDTPAGTGSAGGGRNVGVHAAEQARRAESSNNTLGTCSPVVRKPVLGIGADPQQVHEVRITFDFASMRPQVANITCVPRADGDPNHPACLTRGGSMASRSSLERLTTAEREWYESMSSEDWPALPTGELVVRGLVYGGRKRQPNPRKQSAA